MNKSSITLDRIVASFFIFLLSASVVGLVYKTGFQAAQAYEGTDNTLSPGYIEGMEANFSGVRTPWIDLDGNNRTSWPSGGTGSIEELSFSYLAFTNASGTYMVDGNNGSIVGESADADDVFNAIDGNQTSLGTILVKAGTYDLDSWTPSNDWKMVGEEGTVFNLTGTPSITFSGKVSLENINFTTTLDGQTHIIIKDDFRLEGCILDLKINCTQELEGVIDNQDAEGDNIVEFIDCDLYAGKDTAQYFVLFETATTSADSLIFRNFRIRRLLFNTSQFYWTGTKWVGKGRVGIVEIGAGDRVEYVNLENIRYDQTDVRNIGSFFLSVHGHAGAIIIDGFYCENGLWNDTEKDSFIAPLQMFDYADYVIIDDMILRTQFHPIVQAKHFELNNFIGIGTGDAVAAWDLGSTDPLNATAHITNWHSSHVSLAMNTGWGHLHISASDFNCSRIYVIDEGSPTGQKKYLTLVNVDHTIYPFWPTQHLNYSNFIQISYGQGTNLAILKLVGVTSYQMENTAENALIYAGDSASQYPTHYILDTVSVTGIREYSWPRFIQGAVRTNDDQKIWMTNCDIMTYQPPLDKWNPIRVNDHFDKIVWHDTNDNDFNYSERVKNATIPSGSSEVTIHHEMPSRTIWSNVQITATSDLANCTYFWWTWSDFTDSQLKIYVGASGAAKNGNDDITFIVKFELKP